MRGTAVVVGATGQIGRAAVSRLVADGWRVTAVSRTDRADGLWPAEWGVRPVRADRDAPGGLAAAVGSGCEVLVDVVAEGRAHARQLLALADRIGSAVVLSSVNVYLDDRGRGFATQEAGFPAYPVPLTEEQPTLAPGTDSHPARKAALEAELRAADLPVTLLRAGAVYGVGSVIPREWFFVKRALDGRRLRLLPYRGESRFHPAASANIAELVRLAAARPGARVLNAADPTAPTVREIATAVDRALGREAPEVREVPLDGMPEGHLGASPWSVPHPIVLDMTRAERELGYRPVTDHATALPETVDWLCRVTEGRRWQEVFPRLPAALAPHAFDYAAEDRLLATLR